MREIRIGSRSPWGTVDYAEKLGEMGIVSVQTPGHGGIYVPPNLVKHMPEKYRAYTKKWSNSENWYEEDCAWACVAVTFQELFKPEVVKRAKQIVAEWVENDV